MSDTSFHMSGDVKIFTDLLSRSILVKAHNEAVIINITEVHTLCFVLCVLFFFCL